MPSPNAFLSPPGSARRKSRFFASSPDLPSLQDILLQSSKNPPQKLGSKAEFISNDAKTNSQTCSTVLQPPKALKKSRAKKAEISANGDDAIPVIEAPADPDSKPRKPRRRKEPTGKRKVDPKHTAEATSPTRDQPRKPLKSCIEDDKNGTITREQEDGPDALSVQGETDSFSKPVAGTSTPEAARKPAKTKKDDKNEPLLLESAMARRLDWTPPTQKAPIVLDPDSSVPRGSHTPSGHCEMNRSFEQLLGAYKCAGGRRQDMTVIDEDSSFLRKRKLIELVPTTAPNAPVVQNTEKSPIKQKAPKKKPRTITELATAAYKVQSPLESVSTTVPLAKDASNEGTDGASDEAVDQGQGKGKAKPRKRASKASKKKPPPPPKLILLPPSEALKVVAKQDFVFGTSSQLAVENSPTFLRDLQSAMDLSNQPDYNNVETPLNSDAIEPLEQRPKLWSIGARDADGDLFDIGILEIAEGPSQPLPAPHEEDDPFGYFRRGERPVDPASIAHIAANCSQQDDPFVDLPDEPRSLNMKAMEAIENEHESFLDSQLSTGSPIRKRIHSSVNRLPKAPSDIKVQPSKTKGEDMPYQVESQRELARPSYDLYTDAQLSREITSYGFKAVKSRKAKISLLEQCWQSKAQMSQISVRTLATMSSNKKGQGVTKQRATIIDGKRARKNSVSASEAQEPPPSAQPPEPPKPRRGRPKKGVVVRPGAGAVTSKKLTSPAKLSKVPTTPKCTMKATKVIIEIPDSATECGSDLSTTPHSSPEPTFSPAPHVDLSLSLDYDTDMSQTVNSDELSSMFSYISKAITTAPRTTDPANPSWHEKMLLYDPIMLEDLTAWLNCGQLTRAGFDGEVKAGEVKKWCESKSVCCLWRVNLRGKERKRL